MSLPPDAIGWPRSERPRRFTRRRWLGALLGLLLGLLTGSVNIGLATTSILGTVYIVFFRKYVRSKLSAEDKPSNVDSILGRNALVTEAIAPNKPGQVKVSGELWRAILADGSSETKSAGENVSVVSIDGVTLHVR